MKSLAENRCLLCKTPLRAPSSPCPRCVFDAALEADEELEDDVEGDARDGSTDDVPIEEPRQFSESALTQDDPSKPHRDSGISASQTTLTAGSTLGVYEVTGPLGHGGMGEVYGAKHVRLDRSVALKILPPELSADAGRRQRFLHEARTSSALDHPNIVTVHDLIEHEGADVIVMELVDGETLTDILRNGPLEPRRALEVGLQIAQGLTAAHAAGIVHRDLKPGNVMLRPGDRVKLLDFGLAKAYTAGEEERTMTEMTRVGAVIGTAAYMSPEQARGEIVGPASDIFSFGILLYEMLAGHRPFAGREPIEMLHDICYADPMRLAEAAAGERFDAAEPRAVELQALLNRLLEKKPEERGSGEELVEDLRELRSEFGAGEIPAITSVGQQSRIRGIQASRADDRLSGKPSAVEPTRADSVEATLTSRGLWAIGIAALAMLALVGLYAGGFFGLGQIPGVAGTEAEPAAFDIESVTDPLALMRYADGRMEHFYDESAIDEGISALRKAITLSPESASAYARLALALSEKAITSRDPSWRQQAEANASKALSLDGRLSLAKVAKATCDVFGDRIDEALDTLDELDRTDPANPSAPKLRAKIASRSGEFEEAVDYLNEALRRQPQNPEVLLERGTAFYRLARFDEAAADFQRLVSLQPKNVDGLMSLAAVLHQKADYSGAVRAVQAALEIRPSQGLYSNLGTFYFFQGLYEEAVSAFESAVDLGAAIAVNWYNLGDALRLAGRSQLEVAGAYEQSLRLLEAELVNQPDNPVLRSRRALLFAKLGDRKSATRDLSWIDSLDVPTSDVLHRMTLAWEFLGERASALRALKRAFAEGLSTVEVISDPDLAELRTDRRFVTLMNERASAEEANVGVQGSDP